jgi:hypothetical protein
MRGRARDTHLRRRSGSLGLLLLLVSGCAAHQVRPIEDPGTPGEAMVAEPGTPGTRRGDYAVPDDPVRTPAGTVLRVLSSPFYLAFKVVVCAATTVIVVPGTMVTGISDPDGLGWQRQRLAEGFGANCGPPYWLE